MKMKNANLAKRKRDKEPDRTAIYKEHIETITSFLEIEYELQVLFERDGETALFHERRGIVPGDFIVVNNRVTRQRQLYLLLHEAGHVLLRECEREHKRRYPAAVINGKRPTRAHKIDTLREEVMAWEKGREIAQDFFIAVEPYVDALVMVNGVSTLVRDTSGELLFEGRCRGIGGSAIKELVFTQLKWFSEFIDQYDSLVKIIGVGGLSKKCDVHRALDQGCEAVQFATAAMINPGLCMDIKKGGFL